MAVLGTGFGRDPRVVRSVLLDRPAPPLAGETLEGGLFDLAEARGRVVVVNVWASWCVPCRREHPELVAAARELAPYGVQFVGVNTQDTLDAARAFVDELGAFGYPSVLDPDGRKSVDWGVFGVPETFLVDADGRVRAKTVGAVDRAWIIQGALDLVPDTERTRPCQATGGTTVTTPAESKRERQKRHRQARRRAVRRRNRLLAWIISNAAVVGVVALLATTVVRGTPPPEGTQDVALTTTGHVEGEVTYDTAPPAGGAHASVWQNCGFYDLPVVKGSAVHSLEHSAVWLGYDPALPDDARQTLRQLAGGSVLVTRSRVSTPPSWPSHGASSWPRAAPTTPVSRSSSRRSRAAPRRPNPCAVPRRHRRTAGLAAGGSDRSVGRHPRAGSPGRAY